MTRFKKMTLVSMATTCVLVALLLSFSLMEPAPVEAQNTACFRAQGGALWACGSGGEMEFRSGSTLDVQSGATFSADDIAVADLLSVADLAVSEQLTVSDNATLAAHVVNTKQTVVVVSDGSTVTPLGAFQPISATGNTGTSSIGGCTAGRRVEFINQANVTITFTDTANLRLSSNAALGQYDSLSVRCLDGTIWVEVGETNN